MLGGMAVVLIAMRTTDGVSVEVLVLMNVFVLSRLDGLTGSLKDDVVVDRRFHQSNPAQSSGAEGVVYARIGLEI